MGFRRILQHALATFALAVAVIVAPTPSLYDEDGGGMSIPTPSAVPAYGEDSGADQKPDVMDCRAPEMGDTCRA